MAAVLRMMENLWPFVPHFIRAEFDSKDKDGSGVGTGDQMNPFLVFMLVAIRKVLNLPLRINSGFRTEKHNKAIGGAIASAHLTGNAADVSTVGWTKQQRLDFVNYARKLGCGGIGIAKNYIHVDVLPRVASWRYTTAGTVKVKLGDEPRWL